MLSWAYSTSVVAALLSLVLLGAGHVDAAGSFDGGPAVRTDASAGVPLPGCVDAAARRADSGFRHRDPFDPRRGLEQLMRTYDQSRSQMRAWLAAQYAEALAGHPDFEGTDEQPCAYRRLARQWRWLAGCPQPAAGPRS